VVLMTARLEYLSYEGLGAELQHGIWLPPGSHFGTAASPGWEDRAKFRDDMIEWCREQYGPETNTVWAVHGSTILFARIEDAFALQMRFG
jgi:hypothetical protein